MKSILHILNGDSTRSLFERSGIIGDVAVCREAFCSGPTVVDIRSDTSAVIRSAYLIEDQDNALSEYQKQVVSQFERITEHASHEEVCLWFEYDLFCQINLSAVCSLLLSSGVVSKVSLVCVGVVEGSDKMLGLGELNSELYPDLFDQRILLTKAELFLFQNIWQIYNNDDHSGYLELKIDPERFPYTQGALNSHLLRFPNEKTGLSVIEHKILELVEAEPLARRTLIGKLLRWQEWFGMGDLQYLHITKLMNGCFHEENEILHLSHFGRAVLDGTKILKYDEAFGGVKRNDFSHNGDDDGKVISLLKTPSPKK